MYKLIVIFEDPGDIPAFEDQWARQFMPLAEQMPGIRRVQVNTIVGSPEGQTRYHKIHEFYFDDLDALHAALDSDYGVRAGQALMGFAAEIATVLFADVLEDDRPLPRHHMLASEAESDDAPADETTGSG